MICNYSEETGFCELCKHCVDYKDLRYLEDQDCNSYYICGACWAGFLNTGRIDKSGYVILDEEG